MSVRVLAADVGTTKMKLGVVADGRETIASAETAYPMDVGPDGEAEIDPARWWNAFLELCPLLPESERRKVEAIGFSVSTPGAMAFNAEGNPLTPAVLFLDGRSHAQAREIRNRVGEDALLEHTANLPVSGGCTASTLLWWRDRRPEIFNRAAMFGHTNTFFCKRLTGNWGMDPSTASLTALYNTASNDRTWNREICGELGVPVDKLPSVIEAREPAGGLTAEWAARLGLPAGIPVLMGGNDAMCAALTGGVTRPGAVLDIGGTCEIVCVGLPRALGGRNYNVRCHVIPGMWSTLYVLNTGGKALEWFHANFCREMDADGFFAGYLPETIAKWFDSDPRPPLPDYEVFLAGDRYSAEPRTAAFSGLRLGTTRETMLMAMIRGNNRYLARHLEEMAAKVPLSKRVHLTGGGLPEAIVRCKREWMGDYEYVRRDNSSMLGAAQLAHFAVTGEAVWEGDAPEPNG